jgi:hypothetical protein
MDSEDAMSFRNEEKNGNSAFQTYWQKKKSKWIDDQTFVFGFNLLVMYDIVFNIVA